MPRQEFMGLKKRKDFGNGDGSMGKEMRGVFWKLLFAIYLALLIYVVFIKAYGDFYRFPSGERHYNLVLFDSIRSFNKAFNNYSFEVCFLNIYGNILAFMPFGFLFPLISVKNKFLKTFFLGVVLSAFIEIMQYITNLGILDVDDILLNGIGVFLGFVSLKLISFIFKTREKNNGHQKNAETSY